MTKKQAERLQKWAVKEKAKLEDMVRHALNKRVREEWTLDDVWWKARKLDAVLAEDWKKAGKTCGFDVPIWVDDLLEEAYFNEGK